MDKAKLEQYLVDRKMFNTPLPHYVENLVASLDTTLPEKAKTCLVLSELVNLAGTLRINIELPTKELIPVNALTFIIAKSGAAKDSTAGAIKTLLKPMYERIQTTNYIYAKSKAIEKAIDNGADPDDAINPSQYRKYMLFLPQLKTGVSTSEGFIQYLNDVEALPFGTGYMYTGEIGAEINKSQNAIECLLVLAEVYDSGEKEAKVLKDRTSQTKPIKCLPVNGLFMGSEDNILYTEKIKEKIKVEFNSKLARRSFFVFCKNVENKKEYDTVEDFLAEHRTKILNTRVKALDVVEELNSIFQSYMDDAGIRVALTLSEEVQNLFTVYKTLGEYRAAEYSLEFPMAKLHTHHIYWRALKLAGAFAILRKSPIIDVIDYAQAASYLESIKQDMYDFEEVSQKESYELLCDRLNEEMPVGENSISLHTLKKQNFIGKDIQKNMRDLKSLCSAYDRRNLYDVNDKMELVFTKIAPKTSIYLSYAKQEAGMPKKQRMLVTQYGYKETKFELLYNMLQGDYSYSNFQYKDGYRCADNVIPTTSWIALDVDDGKVSDEEMHEILGDLNHYVVRTSDPDNAYKYRVILDFDAEITVTNEEWKKLQQELAKSLFLEVDCVPVSQMFLSYSNRNILSVTAGTKINIVPFLSLIRSTPPVLHHEVIDPAEALKDIHGTFGHFMRNDLGCRQTSLYTAVVKAKNLGMPDDDICKLIDIINGSYRTPLGEREVTRMKTRVPTIRRRA